MRWCVLFIEDSGSSWVTYWRGRPIGLSFDRTARFRTCSELLIDLHLLHIVAALRVFSCVSYRVGWDVFSACLHACYVVTSTMSHLLFNARCRLIQDLCLVLCCTRSLEYTLIDPSWDLTGIIVWELTFKCELAALSTFTWAMALRVNLWRCSESLFNLLYLMRLQIDWFIDALSVFHLLRFIAIRESLDILNFLEWVHTGITLRIGRPWLQSRHVMEINRVFSMQVHLILTRLAYETLISKVREL